MLLQSKQQQMQVTSTKLYVPVVVLSAQGNAKLLQQLRSGFKITVDWKKYQSKVTIQKQNQYLDYLKYLSLHGVNRLFVRYKQFTQDIFFQK